MLINNAAQDPGVRLVEIVEEDFRRIFDVNFFAPVAATLAVLPVMVERGHGTIVNVSSDGGRLPSPGAGRLPLVEGGAVGLHRVNLVPAGPQGGPRPRRLPRLHGHRAGAGGARTWTAPASADDDPHRGGSGTPDPGAGGWATLEISASGLIDAATVFRSVMPRTYHRLRRNW